MWTKITFLDLLFTWAVWSSSSSDSRRAMGASVADLNSQDSASLTLDSLDSLESCLGRGGVVDVGAEESQLLGMSFSWSDPARLLVPFKWACKNSYWNKCKIITCPIISVKFQFINCAVFNQKGHLVGNLRNVGDRPVAYHKKNVLILVTHNDA